MITICACESQPIIVEGLASILSESHDFELAGVTSDPAAVLDLVGRHQPQVFLIDKTFGAQIIFPLIAEMRRRSPETQPVLWASEIVEVESFRALQAGARGILKKTLPPEAILECLRAVAHGNIWIENSVSNRFAGFLSRPSSRTLTARQQEILELVMRGNGNRQIADALYITVGTVKVHLMHIFEKVGVKTRFELALYGMKSQGTSPADLAAPAARPARPLYPASTAREKVRDTVAAGA